MMQLPNKLNVKPCAKYFPPAVKAADAMQKVLSALHYTGEWCLFFVEQVRVRTPEKIKIGTVSEKHVNVVIMPGGPETAAKYRLVFPSMFTPLEVFNTLNTFFTEQENLKKPEKIEPIENPQPLIQVTEKVISPIMDSPIIETKSKEPTNEESFVGLKDDPELTEYIAKQMFGNIPDANITFTSADFTDTLLSSIKVAKQGTGNIYRCLERFGYIESNNKKSGHKVYQLTDKTKQLIGKAQQVPAFIPEVAPIANDFSKNVFDNLAKDWQSEITQIEKEIQDLDARKETLNTRLTQLKEKSLLKEKALELMKILEKLND